MLIKWLRHAGQPVRVVVEASGIYSLDLALALHDADGIEVMLTNPRVLKDYRRASMRRSKTDKIDAEIICDYAARMPFVPWQPPVGEVLELQQIARRIQALVVERTRETNRLHVAQSTYTSCAVVWNSPGLVDSYTRATNWAIAHQTGTRYADKTRLYGRIQTGGRAPRAGSSTQCTSGR